GPLPRAGVTAGTFRVPHPARAQAGALGGSIAPASLLPRVERAAHMLELARLDPQCELARNRGYGTPEHLAGLARHGPCPEHRKTFQPVKDYLLPLFPFSPGAA